MSERPRVLLIDDERAHLTTMVEILGENYAVSIAREGVKGLELARSAQAPDIVLLDVFMPGMSGYEVCRQLKLDPNTSHIPVIFLTIKSDVKDEMHGFEQGAVDYITKPFSPPVVLARVRAQLKLVEQQRELESQVAAALRTQGEIRELNSELASRATELENAIADLESFSYSVAHDLRTPLRSIAGFCKLLTTQYGPQMEDKGQRYLERIYANCLSMEQLIAGLLTLGRVSRKELVRESVNLSHLAEAAVLGLTDESPHRQVVWRTAPGLKVQGDSGLLHAVLQNLLGNAFKFTRDKAEAVIEFGQEPARGGLAFFVRDNGAGFDMAYAGKLFGVFERLHGEDEFEGSGVGLAIVHRIVRRHGGEIWAESAPGAGATFWFTLGKAHVTGQHPS